VSVPLAALVEAALVADAARLNDPAAWSAGTVTLSVVDACVPGAIERLDWASVRPQPAGPLAARLNVSVAQLAELLLRTVSVLEPLEPARPDNEAGLSVTVGAAVVQAGGSTV
jgi:hypothetical protein